MRKLLDFDLAVEASGDGYRTQVIASPTGEAQGSLVLPFTDKDLRILVLEVVGSIGRLRRKVRRIDAQDRLLVENFGSQLYQALFAGPVGDCLERSRVFANSRDAGLRIRLRLPGALANVPWEYLYDPQHGFLGLDPDTALVRYLELPDPVRPFPVRPPLRVLAMISAPSDLAQLDAEQEWARLNQALEPLASRGLVEVDRLAEGRLSALPRAMRLREYHVLHFIGHGGYDEEAEDGALALEDGDGKTRLVTGRNLGMMIRHPSLRLVVLNACEGSRVAPDDPFSGVAQALARHGIPAVVAMQFEISDQAALAFSQSFYQAIADGLPVDVATVEARRAMFADDNEIEWATPVLYLRSPDGRVFARRRASPSELADPGSANQRDAAQRQEAAREEAAREEAAREEAARQEAQRLAAERLGREETRTLGAEHIAAPDPAPAEPKPPATRPQPPVPVLAFGPLILSVPLLILAMKVFGASFASATRLWVWVLCSAVLGGIVAAVEHRRRPIPVWTAALEFFFAWFGIFALFKLNVGNVHSIVAYVPPRVILAGVGAIVSALLCQRALARSHGKDRSVHPVLPAFLICMVAGLVAAAIGYAYSYWPAVQILQRIGPGCYHIGGVVLLAALVADLLAPVLALVRNLNAFRR